MRQGVALLGVLLLAVLAPSAAAHGGANPRAQDTRLLHDHNDDCGGDGVTGNCRGTIDLIALDIQERHAGGEQVVFRFLLDKGQSGSQRLTLTYSTPSGAKSFDATTSDHSSFSGSFDSYQVSSAGDGTRVILEARMSADKAGITEGAKASGFRVEARRDGTLGDFMPGGYQGALGTVQDPPQGDAPTSYKRPDYTGRGSKYYVQVDAGMAEAQTDGTRQTWRLRNLLDAPQTITLSAAATTGDATFSDGQPTKVIDLARRGTQEVQVLVRASGEGDLSLAAATDLGGRTVATTPFVPGGGAPEPTTPQPTATPTKDASAAPLLLALAALALAARPRRS